MDYTNNSNKYLLWELLQDSGIFNNMQNNKYNKIQEIFENTIFRLVSTNYAPPQSLLF